MKLVFNREETAAALGKTPADFDTALPALLTLGFPKPVQGLGSSWSIMEVIRWINREESPTLQSVMTELEGELTHH